MKAAIYALILFLPLTVAAEHLWFTDAGAGAHDGSSLANAWSVSEASTSGNWGVGAGKISAGDVLWWSGTITGPLTIQGGGSAGSPVSIIGTNSPAFTKAHWNGANGNAAIYDNGWNDITIDGGGTNNLGIVSTANGTGLANQLDNRGVRFDACARISVINLAVRDLYIRTPESLDPNALGVGIDFRAGCYIGFVSNVVCTNMNVGVFHAFVDNTNFFVFNSTFRAHGEGGIVIGASSGSSTLTNVIIAGNDFSDCQTWGGFVDIHCNHIHIFAVQTGANAVGGCVVRNNYFHGSVGSRQTSFAFIEGGIFSAQVYNNLFEPSNNDVANGLLFFYGASNSMALHNTFIGVGGMNAIATADQTADNSHDGNITITNNLFKNVSFAIYDPATNVIGSDYNCATPGTQWQWGVGADSFGGWKAETGWDSHSNTNVVSLDGSFVPTVGDTGAKDLGKSIAFITTDKLGIARPQGVAYDIGAFEFQSIPGTVPATIGSGRGVFLIRP